MRMCVVVGWSSVGGPPGVPDTRGGLRERVLADEGLEIDELARLLPDLKAPFTDHRHAGRVITAVLKATQPGYHDFQGLLDTMGDSLEAAGKKEDVSLHLCFICLLHLANENTLKIEDCPTMDRLTIQQD